MSFVRILSSGIRDACTLTCLPCEACQLSRRCLLFPDSPLPLSNRRRLLPWFLSADRQVFLAAEASCCACLMLRRLPDDRRRMFVFQHRIPAALGTPS